MTNPRARVHRTHAVAALILSLAILMPVGIQRTYGQDSPASGGAQVIAQGLTAPPADRSVWRVVKQNIPTRLDAVPSVRMQSSAGFLLSDDVDLFVVDQRTKLRSRLAPGEAEFVPTGANQTWASLDKDAGHAWTLELVDRGTADVTTTGDVTYGSGSFATEPGDYDLDLLRDRLSSGDRTSIPAGSYPTLVLATSGQITITSDREKDPIRLKADQAKAVKGKLTIKSRGDDPAVFVAAVLGEPITGGEAAPTAQPTKTATPTSEATKKAKATRTPTPKPTKKATPAAPGIGEGASIRIAVRLCRSGMTYFALDPRGCARADGDFALSLIAPDGSVLDLKAASKTTDNFVRWSGLDAGTYVLVVDGLPEGYLSYSLDGYICCTTNTGYEITVGKKDLVDGTLYLFQEPFGVGAPPVVVPTAAPQPTAVPEEPNPGQDSDGDGLSDELELDVFGTSPYLGDSDGDTIPDGTEAFGLNGWLTAPAQPDTDHDGVDDNVEIDSGTNPVDPTSF